MWEFVVLMFQTDLRLRNCPPEANSRTASESYRYFSDFVSMKRYSCDRVGRSFTLSGMAFGLFHTMSLRRYQPISCRANASRQGIPIRSLSFRPGGLSGRVLIALFGFFLSGARHPRFPLVYPSPILSHRIPSGFSTRFTSAKTPVSVWIKPANVGSSPIWPLIP